MAEIYGISILVTFGLAALLTALALDTWRRRRASAVPAIGMTLAVAEYVLGTGITALSQTPETWLFWQRIRLLGLHLLPVITLVFTLHYTGIASWLRLPWSVFLYIEPLVSQAILWLHYDTFLTYPTFTRTGAFLIAQESSIPSTLLQFQMCYSYALLLASAILIMYSQRNAPHDGRAVAAVLIGAISLPAITNLLVMLNVLPELQLFLRAWGAAGMSICFIGASQHSHIADPRPIAHRLLLDLMNEGALVLDARERIVDLNRSAADILGAPAQGTIGQPARLALHAFPQLLERIDASSTSPIDASVGLGAAARCYEVHISTLTSERGWQMGKLIVFYDITEQQQAQQLLLEQQRSLAMLEERERLAREFHGDLQTALERTITCAQQAHGTFNQDRQATDVALARLTAIAQDANADVREYLLGVKTTSTTENGFLPALRQYAEQYGKIYHIQVECDVPAEFNAQPFELLTQVQLLRIVQETLTNVRKFTHATCVHLNLTLLDDQGQIILQDNDIARGASGLNDERSLQWLQSIRERAAEIGGKLEIRWIPGQGTQTLVQFPVQK
jgi:signal transduction histidine kinase